MIKSSRIKVLFCLLGMIGLSVIFSIKAISAQAQTQLGSDHTQTLNIIKYSFTNNNLSFTQDLKTNTKEKINNIPIEDYSSELIPLSEIHYTIQKITPKTDGNLIKLNDPSTYTINDKPVDLVTNKEGLASGTFTDGFYIVSEQPNINARLFNVAPPLLLRLPVENVAKDNYLNEVYIYPKSSVEPIPKNPNNDDPNPPGKPHNKRSNPPAKPRVTDSTPPKSNHPREELPKTGDTSQLQLSILGSILISSISGFLLKVQINKKERRSDEN